MSISTVVNPSYIFILNRSDSSSAGLDEVEVSQYWSLIDSPIYIDDMSPDDNWNTIAYQNFWCTGNGTTTDPYIIQNVIISSTDSDCIEIRNSDVHFILTNCIIFSSQKELGSGIFLQKVNNGHIMYSQIYSCDSYGITISFCSDVFVYQNTIYNNGWMGINLGISSNYEIVENTLYNNSVAGIGFFQSNNTIIDGNEIYSHYTHGIGGGHCLRSDIRNNNIHNNTEGINLYMSNFNVISQNTITNNIDYGIQLRMNCDYNTISRNSLSGSTYCITIGSSCKENEIFDNGDCQLFTLDESRGDGGGSDNGNNNGDADENHPENLAITGYNLMVVIGLITIGIILFFLIKLRSMEIKSQCLTCYT